MKGEGEIMREKQIMNDLFDELVEINGRHKLDTALIADYAARMSGEKVCAPVIGHFSTGKSAVINALLGYPKKLLREGLTPETALPTEIAYGTPETAAITYLSGAVKTVSRAEYERASLSASEARRVRLTLDNPALSPARDVMLVDMPGFESSDDAHDKAIDDYVNESMAYIVTLAADAMVLTESIGNAIKELCSFKKDLYFLITKTDKKAVESDYQENLSLLKAKLPGYVGDREIKIFETSAAKPDVAAFAECLALIQESAGKLLNRKFADFYRKNAGETASYLDKRLQTINLSESQLAEEEEKLEKSMAQAREKARELAADFERDTAGCASDVANDVRAALEGIGDSLVSMALSRNEGALRERVKSAAQIALNDSMRKRFFSKAEKYLRKASSEIVIDPSFGAIGVKDAGDGGASGGGDLLISTSVLAGLYAIHPILGAIASVLTIVGSLFLSSQAREEKLEQQRQQVRSQISGSLIPDVVARVDAAASAEIAAKVGEVTGMIAKDLEEKETILKKAIEENRVRQNEEKAAKDAETAKIREDRSRLEESMKRAALYAEAR
jgi:GTP-binding protein EngB required for normal cell division